MSRSKRVKISRQEHAELLGARKWAAENGMESTVRYYDELLEFHYRRGALPGPAERDDHRSE